MTAPSAAGRRRHRRVERRPDAARVRSEPGQASMLVVGGLVALVLGALVLGLVARGGGREARAQRAADLAALAGARAMHDAYARLFEPVFADRARPGPRHLAEGGVPRARTRGGGPRRGGQRRARRARGVPRRGLVRADAGAGDGARPLRGPDRGGATVRADHGERRGGARAARGARPTREAATTARSRSARASACAPTSRAPSIAWSAPRAPTASRSSSSAASARTPSRRSSTPAIPIRAGSRRRGARCTASAPSSTSGRRAPTAGWRRTRPASTSRSGTAGSPGTSATRSTPTRHRRRDADGGGGGTLPDFVPAAFAPALARAAQRWNVSATLLAAQLYAESNFNPFAVSRAGAQGIAQFMPGTAAAMGLSDPFDAERAIDAQAHLMRDLLRRFPAVPLALAAYNAGPNPVAACGCVPANGETPGYVARILGLMSGAGASRHRPRSRSGSSGDSVDREHDERRVVRERLGPAARDRLLDRHRRRGGGRRRAASRTARRSPSTPNVPPPSTSRSVIPSVTSTSRSALSSRTRGQLELARPVDAAQRRVDRAVELGQRAVGVGDEALRVAAVDPRQHRGRGVPAGEDRGQRELRVPERADHLVHRLRGLLEALSRPARGAQRAERAGAQAGGGRARAGGVGDREPGAVAVLDEVEPVAADLVGGQQPARELRARDAGDARGEQVVLDLGRGRRRLAAARATRSGPCSRWPARAPRRPGARRPRARSAACRRTGAGRGPGRAATAAWPRSAASSRAGARSRPAGPSGTISGPSAGGASSVSGKSSEPASRISREPSMSTT